MGELNDEIERLSRIDYYPPEKRIRLALKGISELRALLASAEAERDAARMALREIRATSREYDGAASTAARYNRCLRIVDAALAEVGQEQQHLVCSACGRASDTEPRGGLCGMPRPPLG